MQPNKSHKIDLNHEYPCPSCSRKRRGRLVAIALTEAFGCNRCQQIFVIEDNGYVIEQLSSTYPYKRAWYWTGSQWVNARSDHQERYRLILISLIIILVVIIVLLLLKH